MCNHNNSHKILCFHNYKKKIFSRSHTNLIMPYTLKQLEGRRDSCIKKIQEIKDLAKEREGLDLGDLSFNSGIFFSGLIKMPKEDIDSFLSFFPQLPRILDLARQAAIEEKRRRKFEVAIAKFRREKRMKYQRFIEGEDKKDEKKRKRLKRLAAPPALKASSSQAIDQSSSSQAMDQSS